MNRIRFAFLAAVILACACRDPQGLTQTVIRVEADPEVQAVVSHVTVLSRSLLDDAVDEASSAEHPDWPMRIVLAPLRGDAARRFELLFSALGEGGQVFAFRLESGFVQGTALCANPHPWKLHQHGLSLVRQRRVQFAQASGLTVGALERYGVCARGCGVPDEVGVAARC